MDELVETLTENCPYANFDGTGRLINDRMTNGAFDISITAENVTPENFSLGEAAYAPVQRLRNA